SAHGDTPVLRRNQVIVEKPILFIPKRQLWMVLAVHGIGDVDVMFPELARQVFVNGVLVGQRQGDAKHALRKGGHPARAIGLAQEPAGWKLVAIERADIVHAEKAALKAVLPTRVFAIDPPGELKN